MSDDVPPTYSVVVPVFCEAESLQELTQRVTSVFDGIGKKDDFELIFVDDGSRDSTPDVIKTIESGNKSVHSVTLRGNCGKSMALMAGFKNARGDVIVIMDGDLQDNPEDVPKLINKLDSGYDIVNGWRQGRKDTTIRKLGSLLYNSVVGYFTKLYLHDHNCGMKIFRKDAAEALCIYGQFHRYIPLQAHLLGFQVTEEPISNDSRKYGHSKYNTVRYEGLFDLFSMMFLYRFGNSPLHFFGLVSTLFTIPSLALLTFWFIRHMFWLMGYGDEFMLFPRPLLFLSLTALMIGTIIFLTGFMCDFILHHLVRQNIEKTIDLNIKKSSGDRQT